MNNDWHQRQIEWSIQVSKGTFVICMVIFALLTMALSIAIALFALTLAIGIPLLGLWLFVFGWASANYVSCGIGALVLILYVLSAYKIRKHL